MFLHIPRAHDQGQICIYGFISIYLWDKRSCISTIPPVTQKELENNVFLLTLQLTALLLKSFPLLLHCFTLPAALCRLDLSWKESFWASMDIGIRLMRASQRGLTKGARLFGRSACTIPFGGRSTGDQKNLCIVTELVVVNNKNKTDNAAPQINF